MTLHSLDLYSVSQTDSILRDHSLVTSTQKKNYFLVKNAQSSAVGSYTPYGRRCHSNYNKFYTHRGPIPVFHQNSKHQLA